MTEAVEPLVSARATHDHWKRLCVLVSASLEAVLRGYGAVLFLPSRLTGAIVFAATWFNPASAVDGLLGAYSATAAAELLGYSRSLIRSGYYSCGGLLVGLALGQGQSLSWNTVFFIVVGSSFTTALTATLGELLQRMALPALALPFVVVASLFAHTNWAVSSTPWLALSTATSATLTWTGGDVLRALGAIVFQPDSVVGLIVLVAAFLRSRYVALALLSGALLGGWLSQQLGLQGVDQIAAEYNAALTCAAVGVVFSWPCWQTILFGLASAALAAWMTAAWTLTATPGSAPVYAWPFVIVTLVALRAMRMGRGGRWLPVLGTTPEGARATVAQQLRLGDSALPRLLPPVGGTWTVTQGFDGPHTHQGLWRHALDFEITDLDGFPFSGTGEALSDYYCYGKPVLSPGYGVVVAVHDGLPDNPPGRFDLVQPWGNAIIIEHGPNIYSVVSHLSPQTAAVLVGAKVAAGTVLGLCGASGRSPRPHLHLQVQARPELGAPTINFELLHYISVENAGNRYSRSGVPVETQRIMQAQVWQTSSKDKSPFAKGVTWSFREAETQVDLVLTQIDKETLAILDGQGGRLLAVGGPFGTVLSRLEHDPSQVRSWTAAFRYLWGAHNRLLTALYQLLPRHLPQGISESSYVESISVLPLLPAPLRWLIELIQLFYAGIRAETHAHVVPQENQTEVQSTMCLTIGGREFLRRSGRIVLNQEGPQLIELYAKNAKTVIYQATRITATRPAESRQYFRGKRILSRLSMLARGGLIFLFTTTISLTARTDSSPAASSFSLEARGDLRGALASARDNASKTPTGYFERLRVAYLELALSDFKNAATSYAKAAALAPKSIEASLGEQQALIAASQFKAAERASRSILTRDPLNYLASSRLAWTLFNLGRFPEAAAMYQKILVLYPGDIEMARGLGYSLLRGGQKKEAANTFRAILRIVPNDPRSQSGLASCK